MNDKNTKLNKKNNEQKESGIHAAFFASVEKRPVLWIFLLAVLLDFLIEILSRHSFSETFEFLMLHPYFFAIGVLIVFATLSGALMVKKRSFTLTVVSIVWLILGFINFILLFLRTSPFSAEDILLLPSCMSIVRVYLSPWKLICVAIAAGLIVLFCICSYKKSAAVICRTKKDVTVFFTSWLAVAALMALMMRADVITKSFSNLNDAYDSFGFVYCFTRSIYDRGISRPDDYSEEKIESIIDDIEAALDAEDTSDAAVSASEETPNIIILQLESFFDVKRLNGISFSKDPVPVFTELKENCPSGYLTVPAIGAGTANTEFEVLTGMNKAHFGAGEYPYYSVLQEKSCESLPFDLKTLGYSSHAIHNNTATFYNRNLVYPNLGFDTFTSLEYMNNVSYNQLGWAKDTALTPAIMDCLDSTQGCDFVFAVSVQAHGRYPDTVENVSEESSRINLFLNLSGEDEPEVPGHHSGNATAVLDAEALNNMPVQVSGIDDEELQIQYTYYVNQLYEMDSFVASLISALSMRSEPTVLVLYGDHLPAFGYAETDMNDGSTPFESEYAIWSNFNLESKDRDLCSYQLGAQILDLLDIHEGVIMRLHQTECNEETYDSHLEMLAYDMLFGDMTAWNNENPFHPSDMKMGTGDIRIHGVTHMGDKVYVSGAGFTPFSLVLLDEHETETAFADSGTLIVKVEDWDKDAKELAVAQSDGAGQQLSVSEPFVLVQEGLQEQNQNSE